MITTCCYACKNYNTCLKYEKKASPPSNTTCCAGCDCYDETRNAGKEWWCPSPKFFDINPKICYERR